MDILFNIVRYLFITLGGLSALAGSKYLVQALTDDIIIRVVLGVPLAISLSIILPAMLEYIAFKLFNREIE